MSIMAQLKGGMKSLNNMEDLLVEELRDLYDAEHRVLDALPRMEEAANDLALKSAFQEHGVQTRGQISQLEECFHALNMEPARGTCDGIKGIIEEGEVLMAARGDARVKDAALIASAQKVEHYEMASYGSARAFAQHLRRDDIARLLQMILTQEGETDHKLTAIAMSNVNPSSTY